MVEELPELNRAAVLDQKSEKSECHLSTKTKIKNEISLKYFPI